MGFAGLRLDVDMVSAGTGNLGGCPHVICNL